MGKLCQNDGSRIPCPAQHEWNSFSAMLSHHLCHACSSRSSSILRPNSFKKNPYRETSSPQPLQCGNKANSVLVPQSLAYEIAPFNIRMTILQTNLETSLLTNKITFAPSLPAYTPAQNPAPLVRTIVGGLLSRLPSKASEPTANDSNPTMSPILNHLEERIESTYPHLPPSMKTALLSETIHAITAIGGHENPPARHIVGYEAVGSVKEKLKTVSEELEDFVQVSAGVDIDDEDEEVRIGGR